jgi:hypothetical protein
MAGSSPDDAEHPPASVVSITVLSVKPVKFGKIFALATVEVDIDGVLLIIHGVRAIRVQPMGSRIDLPMFRRRGCADSRRSRADDRLAARSARCQEMRTLLVERFWLGGAGSGSQVTPRWSKPDSNPWSHRDKRGSLEPH